MKKKPWDSEDKKIFGEKKEKKRGLNTEHIEKENTEKRLTRLQERHGSV
jgi:hypothetical protein